MNAGQISPQRQRLWILGLGIGLIIAFFASLCIGRYSISPIEPLRVIGATLAGQAESIDPYQFSVVIKVRLPRILMAIIVGAGLSVSGASFQSIFANPLVSPDILGVSSASGFGAALAILMTTGNNVIGVQSAALLFGLLATFLVLTISRVQKKTELFVLVLSGVVVRSLFDALTSLIKYVADTQTKLPAITVWLMGSISSSSYRDVIISAAIIVPSIIGLLLLRWKMNLLSLDEEEARSLGINVIRLRVVVIGLATLITATTVSLCGIIQWIGLVIPHIGRLLVGNDHRSLLPASALLGSIYLLLIDGVARTASSAEIPLSILTAIIGAPFFAWILRKTSGGSQ